MGRFDGMVERSIPMLQRSMRAQVIPAVYRHHVYETRVYSGYPEEGGELIETVQPTITLPPGWEKKFNAPAASMVQETCVDCKGVFGKHKNASSKKRCNPCQENKVAADNRKHGKRWYAEHGERLKAEG